jgi:hypothetical protein
MPAKKTARQIDFENIADLTDREIQVMLRQVDTKDLALALLSASGRLKDRIFANVSERVGSMIKDEMSLSASKAKVEIVGVQKRIVNTVTQLVEAGAVSVKKAVKKVPAGKRKLSKEYVAKKRSTRTLARRPYSDLTLTEADELIVGLAEIARAEGVLEMGKLKLGADSLLNQCVNLVVDGCDPKHIRQILGNLMESLLHEQEVKFQKAIEGLLSIQNGENPRIIELKSKAIF